MTLLAEAGTDPSGGMFPPWEFHPATVHFPIAFLLGAVVLDLYAWRRGRVALARAATWLIAAGTIFGLLAAATGLLAFFTVRAHTQQAHGQMYWHLGLNVAAIVLFAALFFLRRRPEGLGTGVRVAGILAAALVAGGGFLGGQIVYRGGAGIDPAILIPEIGGTATPISPQPGGKPGDGENPLPKKPHEH